MPTLRGDKRIPVRHQLLLSQRKQGVKMDIVERLVTAVQEGEDGKAAALAKEVLNAGLDLEMVVERLTEGMREVGNRFERMEIFLPEMMLAARAMQRAMQVLEPGLAKGAKVREKKGTVVIGTVEGDLHEIGKNIVITMLRVNGFEVHDLGADVNALDFIKKAEEVGADVIGASALMTTT
ncbi:MAG TPA: hypothetical protein EYP09_11235, partial [Anaerolineae bacterium]|nr:hypothetical protein [Anaerolineae bacterium]